MTDYDELTSKAERPESDFDAASRQIKRMEARMEWNYTPKSEASGMIVGAHAA